MTVFLISNVLLTFILFKLFSTFYKLLLLIPSHKSMKKIIGIGKIGEQKASYEELFVNYYKKMFCKLGENINVEKRKQLEKNLKRAGINENCDYYMLRGYIQGIGVILFSYIIGVAVKNVEAVSYIIKFLGIIIGILLFYSPKAELNKKIKEKNEKIILEVPRFIKTIQYSPYDKRLDEIVKDYLKIAKDGLRYDLQLLLSDLEAGIEETKTVQRFGDRTGLAEMRELATVLQTCMKNRKGSEISLQFMESKFRDKTTQIIDKELKKRPETLELINEILLQTLVLILILPMAISSFQGIISIMN